MPNNNNDNNNDKYEWKCFKCSRCLEMVSTVFTIKDKDICEDCLNEDDNDVADKIVAEISKFFGNN